MLTFDAVSILYLTLAQATALNLLAPLGATLLTRWLDYGTFGWVDQAGALVALVGVVLVVQPDDVFSHPDPLMPRSSHEPQKFTKGVVCSIVGVVGGIVSLDFLFIRSQYA